MTAEQRTHLKQQVSAIQRRRNKLDKKIEAGRRPRHGPHAPQGFGQRVA